MKRTLTLSFAFFFLIITASTCYALWLVATVTKADAKKMGIEIHSKAAGPNDSRIEMEFKLDSALKGFSKVEMQIDEDGKEAVVEKLREDRSKPGRIVVSFTASNKQLEKIKLRVAVPHEDGGSYYEIDVKTFVEIKKP